MTQVRKNGWLFWRMRINRLAFSFIQSYVFLSLYFKYFNSMNLIRYDIKQVWNNNNNNNSKTHNRNMFWIILVYGPRCHLHHNNHHHHYSLFKRITDTDQSPHSYSIFSLSIFWFKFRVWSWISIIFWQITKVH